MLSERGTANVTRQTGICFWGKKSFSIKYLICVVKQYQIKYIFLCVNESFIWIELNKNKEHQNKWMSIKYPVIHEVSIQIHTFKI